MEPFNCSQIDELLCDYIDGALTVDQKAAFEAHAASCAGCKELVADVAGAVNFMERVSDVETPKQLVTRILYHTPKQAPLLDALAKTDWIKQWIAPLLAPRFAMGMAMTILSFSMLGKFVTPVRQLKPSDLDPAKVWRNIDDSAHRTWDRIVKYWDNMKLVYEVQTAIDDIKGESEETNSSTNPQKSGESR
jgi:anti-sigma factor RsiW